MFSGRIISQSSLTGVATYIPSIILLSAESPTVSKMDQVCSFIESVLEIADKPVIKLYKKSRRGIVCDVD